MFNQSGEAPAMSNLPLKIEEIADQLRRIAEGRVPISLALDRCGWDEWGDVPFVSEGWIFTFFNDCDDLDYLDSAMAPDGRKIDFDQMSDQLEAMCAPAKDGRPSEFGRVGCALDLLSDEEHHQLERRLKAATFENSAP